MSIQDGIKAAVATGRLVEFETIPQMSVYRPVFLAPEVNMQIVGPWKDDSDDISTMPVVRADLENFIVHGYVTASFKRTPKAGFRRLSKKGKGISKVWEMRVTQSKPQYRLIGMFAAKDVFVGLELTQRDFIDFDEEIERANSSWSSLFDENEPVCSEKINDYISENVVPLR